ncbi:MAG: V-type ATPase subunit [Gemmatimonadaceae bacterium]|nr:V-type ATPase subunit [Gemmatimonadaceae bacterium]
MTDYSDLVARARGLSGHLLPAEQLVSLCSCPATQLPAQLATLGAIAPDAMVRESDGRQDVHGLERALRDREAQRLQILARWSGTRYDTLAVLFDEEDMRSLRALVRAIVSGVAPEDRATGLIATPGLPTRALHALASSGDVANVASLLVAWQNPYGSAMAVEAARARPELLRYDVALARVFADRARKASRHNSMLRHYAERVIDLANLWTALVLADHSTDVDVASLFVEGGTLVRASDLALAVSAARREPLVTRLLPRVAGTPLASALAVDDGRDAEDCALEALVVEFRALARREPTSVAPVIAFVLQQRAELRTLLRIVWSVSLGVPSAMIRRSAGVAA